MTEEVTLIASDERPVLKEKGESVILNSFVCETEPYPGCKENLYITKLEDLDGREIYIPRLVTVSPIGEPEDVFRNEQMIIGKEFVEGEISDKAKERLRYCLNELKMPLLAATHIAMNKPDMDLSDFDIPSPDTPATTYIGYVGPVMAGKTALVSMLHLYYDVPVKTTDGFTYDTPTRYAEELKNVGFTKETPVEKMVYFFDGKSHIPFEVRKQRPKPEPKPMHVILDELVEDFLGPDREPLVVFDTPGLPTGLTSTMKGLETRDPNIFDAVSVGSFDDVYPAIGGFHKITKRLSIAEYEYLVWDFPAMSKSAQLNTEERTKQIVSSLSEK